MQLFVDDERPMPFDFDVHVKTALEAKQYIATGKVRRISLDHDLGEGGTGYEVAIFIERGAFEGTIPPMSWTVHSQNPVGRQNIETCMRQCERFWSMAHIEPETKLA